METKVAKNDMTRHRLNRKPRWPAHGHRGFLVQRNHESGGIVIGLRLMRDSIFQQRCNTNISVVWHLCRGHRLRRPILHRTGNARYALSGLRGSGGGGMDSNHRLVLFTHALCRLSYPAACGPLGEGFRGTWGLPLSQGSAPRTLSAGERSITSGFNRKVPR